MLVVFTSVHLVLGPIIYKHGIFLRIRKSIERNMYVCICRIENLNFHKLQIFDLICFWFEFFFFIYTAGNKNAINIYLEIKSADK